MQRRSIMIAGAALSVMSFPSLAESQGIPVRKFQSAADFGKAARHQRLTSGAQSFSLPPLPQGIPGFYDPATKTFMIAAASPIARGAPPQMQSMTPASGSAPAASTLTCPPPGQERSCRGYAYTAINVNIVSPGIKAGDTVECTNLIILTTTKTSSGDAIADNGNEESTQFGVGQTKQLYNYFKAVYPATHGGYAYLKVVTECEIPTASDGRKYGPQAVLSYAKANVGLNPFSATFNF